MHVVHPKCGARANVGKNPNLGGGRRLGSLAYFLIWGLPFGFLLVVALHDIPFSICFFYFLLFSFSFLSEFLRQTLPYGIFTYPREGPVLAWHARKGLSKSI